MEQFQDSVRSPRHFHLPDVLPIWLLVTPVFSDLLLPIRQRSVWEQIQEEMIDRAKSRYSFPAVNQMPLSDRSKDNPAPMDQRVSSADGHTTSSGINQPTAGLQQGKSGNNDGAEEGLPADNPLTIHRSHRVWVEADVHGHIFLVDITDYPDAQCPVCLNFKQQPEQYCKQEHSLCHQCASRMRSGGDLCSECRNVPLTNGVTDKVLQRKFYALTTVCNQCQWQGDFWSAEAHQRECRHQRWKCPKPGCQFTGHPHHRYRHSDGCPLTEIICWRCSEPVKLETIREHMEESCAAKPVNVRMECSENTLQQLVCMGQEPTPDVIQENLPALTELLQQLCRSNAEYIDPVMIVLPQIIPCENSGCRFHGTQEQLDEHNQHCKMVNCELCDNSVLSGSLPRHLQSYCQRGIVTCGNEGCDASVERRLYLAHDRVCDYSLMTCSYCRKTYRRGEQSQHQQQCKDAQRAVMITSQGGGSGLSMVVFGTLCLPSPSKRAMHRIGDQVLIRQPNGFYQLADDPDWHYWPVSIDDYLSIREQVISRDISVNPAKGSTPELLGMSICATPVAETTSGNNNRIIASSNLVSTCSGEGIYLELMVGHNTASLHLTGSQSHQQLSVRISTSGEDGEQIYEQWFVPLTPESSGLKLELATRLHDLFMEHRGMGRPVLIGVFLH